MNQIKIGTILSYGKIFINVAVGLFYVPLILSFLSIEQYGLYQLVASFIAYLSILDFGLSGTITRFYSQKIALNDEIGKENVIALSLIIYSAISMIILCIGFIIYQTFGQIYSEKLSAQEIRAAKEMLVLLVVDIALLIPSHVFTAVLTSHERFIFLRLLSIVRTISQPFLVMFLLTFRPAALSIVIVQVVLDLMIIIITIGYALDRLHLKIKLHSIDRELLKSMLTFSLFIFINIIVDQIYWGTGQLILGAVAGTATVAIYSIAIQFNNYLKQFSTAIISVLLPRVTKMVSVSSDMNEINAMFIKIGRVQFIVIGLIISGFIVFGKSFINLWIGDSYAPAYMMALIMMIPYSIDLTISLGNLILQAMNLHSRRSYILIVSSIMQVGLAFPLSIKYGGVGCAISVGISLTLGNGFATIIYLSKVGLNMLEFWKKVSPLLIAVIFSSIVGKMLTLLLQNVSWMGLILNILIYVFFYSIVLWFVGLNKYEKHMIAKVKQLFIR